MPPEPRRRDPNAPASLILEVRTSDGRVWGVLTATAKHFSSGSIGFHANGKVENPDSHERYQVGANLTLIGSKPEDK